MKLILIAALVIFTTKAGYGKPDCESEIMEYGLGHILCLTNAMEVQNVIIRLAKNKTTYEEIEPNISGICKKAESNKCYNEILIPINGSCNDVEKMQHFRNAARILLTFNKFMCKNDGTKFKEFLQNGGASCYLHPNKKACYKDAKISRSIGDENAFKDKSVCSILEADWSCQHHYRDAEICESKVVNTDYIEILQELKGQFNCQWSN